MIQFEEFRIKMLGFEPKIKELSLALDLEGARLR
jgi:hypothetical protein